MTWERFARLRNTYPLPPARVVQSVCRLAARPSFEESGARDGHVRICRSRGWVTLRGHPASGTRKRVFPTPHVLPRTLHGVPSRPFFQKKRAEELDDHTPIME